MLTPVPAPKIQIPTLLTRLIPRDRLLTVLDGGDPRVVLVCAPAGYGKTTLLSTWAVHEAGEGPPVAWVQFDEEDNDPLRFWSAILRAMCNIVPPMESGHLGLIDGQSVGAFRTAFVNALDQAETPVCLILDDLHNIQDPGTLASLNGLLAYLPRHFRLIMASRTDPRLSQLSRLRLEGRLREIGTPELEFRRHEAIALLATHDVHLCDRDLDLVLARTEGWPAGLRMAGISLARADDVSTAVREFVEDDRNAADYLFSVVLHRQPDEVRRFVLATSICEQFTAELAEAITGYDGADLLAGMERSNALITRTGPSRLWYRYHSLLRSYLYAELRRGTAVEPLHRRAAVWFEANGDYPTALEHAVAAADAGDIVRLVAEHGVHMVLAGSGATVRRLLRSAPVAALLRPETALIDALAAVTAGDLPSTELRLASVRPQITSHTSKRLRYLYATIQLIRARLIRDAGSARSAYTVLDGADTGDPNLDLLALANRGATALWLGDQASAGGDLIRAHALAVSTGIDHLALYTYSRFSGVKIAAGDIASSARIADEAIAYAAARGWSDSPRSAYAYGIAAWSAYHQADHDAAARYTTHAVSVLDGSAEPTTELCVRTVEAAVLFDNGDQPAALHDWREIWTRLGDCAGHATQVAYAAPIELRMALALDEIDHAAEVIDRMRTVPGTDGDVRVLRALLNARRRRAATARGLLAPVLSGEFQVAAVTTRIDAWVLEALLADAAGEDAAARRAIASAVTLASPHRLLRPFYDAGPTLRVLLSRYSGRFGRHDGFIADALAVMPVDGDGPIELLTTRELQLLTELPSMSTVDELAERLYVSASTIKTHLRGIYRKLQVTTRRDAVAAGRRRGLI